MQYLFIFCYLHKGVKTFKQLDFTLSTAKNLKIKYLAKNVQMVRSHDKISNENKH